jgi:asparagine synthase (glutamine-hydrolysing)
MDPITLAGQIVRAAGRAVAGAGSIVVLYSGGIDSSILAHCVRERSPRLFVVGVPGAHDLHAARTGAGLLGLPLDALEVDRGGVERVLERWAAEIAGLGEPMRSVVVTEILAVEAAPPGLLLIGQGADELFHGYAHFQGLDPAAAERRASADLDRLLRLDWPRLEGVARRLGRSIRAPFLDPELRALVQGPDAGLAPGPDGLTKPLLRQAAEVLGVPEPLRTRRKKAMQYGSGVAALLRTMRPAAVNGSD